jgi:hypothetical protein
LRQILCLTPGGIFHEVYSLSGKHVLGLSFDYVHFSS